MNKEAKLRGSDDADADGKPLVRERLSSEPAAQHLRPHTGACS